MFTSLPLVCGNAAKFRMLMFVQCFSQKFWQTIADIDTPSIGRLVAMLWPSTGNL
jgi:hypothetical protein